MRAAAALVLMLASPSGQETAPAQFRIRQDVLLEDADRVGLNLGIWTTWGAEQLCTNPLKNPGFEGLIDRAIIITSSAAGSEFTDDTDWLARPEDFWSGGSYEVLSGKLQGRTGLIVESTVRKGRSHIKAGESLFGLDAGDAISVTRIRDDQLPTQWWFEGGGVASDQREKRPGSAGCRSIRLAPHSGHAAAVSYLDSIGERAGKLLPLTGGWTLSLWAKARRPGTQLHVRLHRGGSAPFIDELIPLHASWTQYSRDFLPADNGPAGTLELRLEVEAAGGAVWLDDVSLTPGSELRSAFRNEVVRTLRALSPGYLRDWQGQLGDTWQNRIATPFGRRASRYRPGAGESTDFGYSLPEFLGLAHEVGAQPWVVLSPAMTETEWRQAGQFLSREADRFRFREILVEFGNENWNDLFRPAGIPETKALLSAAARAFDMLQRGARGDARIRPVLGGHFFNEVAARGLVQSAPPQVLPAFAPYWAFELPGPAALFPHSYSMRLAGLAERREIAIYEMNAHSLAGATAAHEVNRILSHHASGAALAWHSIGALNAGVRRVCVYTLAGFDAPGEGVGRLIRLFGITHDLTAAGRFRPEGEALALLNRAILGDLHVVESGSEYARIAAFRSAYGWSIAAASNSPETQQILITFPDRRFPLPERVSQLFPSREFRLVSQGSTIALSLPPYGFTIAVPRIYPHER